MLRTSKGRSLYVDIGSCEGWGREPSCAPTETTDRKHTLLQKANNLKILIILQLNRLTPVHFNLFFSASINKKGNFNTSDFA
jgi:hypothetical protein